MNSKSQGRFGEASAGELRMVLDALPDAVCLTDAEGTIQHANAGFCDLLGYHQNEIIQRTLDDFLDSSRSLSWFGRSSGRPTRSNVVLQRKDQTAVSVALQACRIDEALSLTIVRPIQEPVDSCLEFRNAFKVVTRQTDLDPLLS